MKYVIKQISTTIIGALAFAAIATVSADENLSSESGYYAFYSGDLRAEYKSDFLPVLSGDKKGVYINTERGIKKIRYSAECRFLPKLGVSDQIVTISDTKFGFDNLRQAQLEAGAMSDMMRDEIATDTAIVLKGGGAYAPSTGVTEEAQAQIKDLKNQRDENKAVTRDSLENDAYNRGQLSDIINVKFQLLPKTDLENVYCAMVVSYLRRSRNHSENLAKVKIVRMKKIGNLAEGKSKKIKFAYSLPEGFVNDNGIEIFLYSGDGKPLATNLSRNLRPLTMKELKKYEALK